VKVNVSKKVFVGLLLLSIMVSFSSGYAWQQGWFEHRRPKVTANVYVFIETASGKDSCVSGNVITNIGEKYVRDILGFDNVTAHNATKWISLSNDASPVQTWTKLPNEVNNANGFGRAVATDIVAWINGGDYAVNFTKKFTATGTQQLQCAGSNWNNVLQSDNNLYACAAFTQTTFNSGDNCTIRWVFTYDAND